jgi:hypothetical protein
MDAQPPYRVIGPTPGSRQVEAWSGYPLQFAGQRQFGWQNQMATEPKAALSRLPAGPGDVLA